jgi:endoglucanase
MWDLPACELDGGRVYSRACDDLIGCAAIVATLQELERSGSEANVRGLFTRAEEVGFVGAMQLAQSGCVPREVTIISLECSSEKAGRRKWAKVPFCGWATAPPSLIPKSPRPLAKSPNARGIPVQRLLMSGGTCEATAYQLYGYRCGALCVALGNYHNCGPDETIAPEFVSLDDVRGLVRWCVEIARCTAPHNAASVDLRARLEIRAAESIARFGGRPGAV